MNEYNYRKLKGRIVEMYGTLDNMAKTMNISNVSLYNKMAGKAHFKQNEISLMCDLLKIPTREIGLYFFTA